MPIGVNQYQILSPDQANPFGYGLSQAVQARFNQAKAQEQEAKNPYVGQQSQADLNSTLLKNVYQQLVNQYTPQDYKTTFASREANTGLTNTNTQLANLKLKYPGLGEGGIVGQLAYMNLLSDHPEIGKRIQNAMTPQQQGGGAMPPQQGGQAPAMGGQPAVSGQAPSLAQGIQGTLPGQNQVFDPLQILSKDINADIGGKQALADWRSMGGGRGGVTQAQQMALQHQIIRDNPGMSADQAYDAAGRLVSGQMTLSDGTPFKVSGLTQLAADKAVMQGTTAPLVTQSLKANQAEAELKVLNQYAQKGLAPYGDTFMGMNANQIMDTFKKDDASQKRLGQFVASQAIQYEAAQNRIRLANGQPGVGSSEELMKLSGQMIKAQYPALSYKARQEAARYLDEALEKGLQARNKFGMHPTNINANVGDQPAAAPSPYSQQAVQAVAAGNGRGQGGGQQAGGRKAEPPITEADIEHTARETGMTVEQVKAKLRQQGRL